MKKRLQGLISGLLIGTMLTSGVVFAKQATETLSVVYDNIKILIDGKEYTPTDALGNTVEPFIYQGTTYLPVRAVANAFDKEVDWEPQTSTVTLGSKNYDWLDQLGFVDFKTTGTANQFSAIPAKTTMSDGIKYDRGIQFFLHDGSDSGAVVNNDGTMECYYNVSYLLNSQYKDFEGIITARDGNRESSAQIKFYGDGNLIYSSPVISNGMKSTNFKVNVSEYKVLKIEVSYMNSRNSWYSITACIADARLSKK